MNHASTPVGDSTPTWREPIKDVRSDLSAEGEIILNLWHVVDHTRTYIQSIRGKLYVASGSDDDKIAFLREAAKTDYVAAEVFPIPEDLKADILVGKEGTKIGKACTYANLELMGGYPALYRDIIIDVPKSEAFFDPSQAMFCMTCLIENENGDLSVQIDSINQL